MKASHLSVVHRYGCRVNGTFYRVTAVFECAFEIGKETFNLKMTT